MEHVSSVRPTGKFPEKVENLKRWARFPGWNFRTEFRVPFTRFSWFVPVSGPRQENLSRPVSKSKWLPSSSCINARFVFFAGPTMEALLHHECPGLVLIGKYLVTSNSNIYSEVHIHWLGSLQFFCWHAFLAICSSDASSLDSSRSPSSHPILNLWHLTN